MNNFQAPKHRELLERLNKSQVRVDKACSAIDDWEVEQTALAAIDGLVAAERALSDYLAKYRDHQ